MTDLLTHRLAVIVAQQKHAFVKWGRLITREGYRTTDRVCSEWLTLIRGPALSGVGHSPLSSTMECH